MTKMKKTNLITILLLCWASLNAQVTPRNILADVIPLESIEANLTSRDTWKPFPKTADEWEQKLPQKLIDIHIKEAESLTDYEFTSIPATVMLDFVRSGDRLRHSKIHFDKRRALVTLILAESMEGKGRFVEQIMNGIWSICEESYWGVPAHLWSTGLPDVENPYVDLFAAETATCLALADYFTGEKLDKINPLIRKRIYTETNERVFEQMLTKSVGYGYMDRNRSVNNWNPWVMSNYMTSALLLEKNEKRRAKMVYEALYGMDAYLNGLGDDGGCDEGPSYWFAAGACVFDCLDMFYDAAPKAPKVYQKPLIQKMASYVYKTHIDGNYFTNFADADPKVKADGVVLYRFGKAINNETLRDFGVYVFKDLYNDDYDNPAVGTSTHHQMRKVKNLLAFDEVSKSTVNYEPVSDAWISDIQLLLSRSQKDGIVFAAHGGHNAESHNHNDVGDFIIYKNGKPLLIDAGRGNYTARTFSSERYTLWFTQSEYHNLPIINGVGQKNGREFEAKNVDYKKSDQRIDFTLDIAKSYPEEAMVKSWKRNLNFDKNKAVITVSDSYSLGAATSLEHVFMSVANIDISEKGKIKLTDGDANLTINYNAKTWDISTGFPSTIGMEYESFKTKWDGKQVQRIVLKHTAPKKDGTHKFKITF
jgi:hypothetical protein